MSSVSMYSGSDRVNRVERLVINMDTTLPNVCSWDECDKHSRSVYQIRTHEHQPVKCSLVDNPPPGYYFGRHFWFAFCSEGHLDLWLNGTGQNAKDSAERNQGRISGMHSPGHKLTSRYR